MLDSESVGSGRFELHGGLLAATTFSVCGPLMFEVGSREVALVEQPLYLGQERELRVSGGRRGVRHVRHDFGPDQ
jgi:hypothetical protein